MPIMFNLSIIYISNFLSFHKLYLLEYKGLVDENDALADVLGQGYTLQGIHACKSFTLIFALKGLRKHENLYYLAPAQTNRTPTSHDTEIGCIRLVLTGAKKCNLIFVMRRPFKVFIILVFIACC